MDEKQGRKRYKLLPLVHSHLKTGNTREISGDRDKETVKRNVNFTVADYRWPYVKHIGNAHALLFATSPADTKYHRL